jgi:hypothetical protein
MNAYSKLRTGFRLTELQLLPMFLGIIFVDVFLMCIWSIIAPSVPEMRSHPTEDGYSHLDCHSPQQSTFLPIILLYKVVFFLLLNNFFRVY